MKKELTVLIGWYTEADFEKQRAFEENKKSFCLYNPNIDIITVMNIYENKQQAWLCSELPFFYWYLTNGEIQNSERYLLVEWDCWCDGDLKQYFNRVWDCDLVVPSVMYPERDNWYWFSTINHLPEHSRKFATGVVPFCGILLSNKAMKRISKEIVKPKYMTVISELRLGTIATMLQIDPVPNPVCNRSITWKDISPFDLKYKGLHHPRKTVI